jgi:hypothetical protein
MDPNLTQFANSAPSVASDRADEFALRLSKEPQQSRVFVPRAARIYLVEPIFQAIDLIWRQIVSRFDPDAF